MRPTRFCGAALGDEAVGDDVARCSTIACENSFTVSQSYFGVSGTTTCRPLPPLVLRKAGEAQLVEQRPGQLRCLPASAPSSTPSPGSRSKIMRSGWSMSRRGRVPGVQLDHVHLRRADQRGARVDLQHRLVVRARRRVELLHAGHLHRARRASGRRARRRRPRARAPARPAAPSGAAGSAARRVVVGDEVELGGAARGVDHAVGVRDAQALDSASAARFRRAAVAAFAAGFAPVGFAAAFAGTGASVARDRCAPPCRRAGRGRPGGGCGRRASTRRTRPRPPASACTQCALHAARRSSKGRLVGSRAPSSFAHESAQRARASKPVPTLPA